MKKTLSIFLALIMLLSVFSVCFNVFADEEETLKNGLVKEYDETYYYVDGDVYYGWKRLDGAWYYFGAAMVKNECFYIDGKNYVFGSDGKLSKGGWAKVSYGDQKRWCYANKNGVASTGWKKIEGKWYGFSEDGFLVTNNTQTIDGKVYLFNSKGQWVTKKGWQKFGDGKWCYVTKSGACKTGWLKSGGTWYCFDEYGAMVDNSVCTVDGKTYVFDKGGKLTTKTGWVKKDINGEKWFYVQKGGVAVTGWKKISKKWYYFVNTEKDYLTYRYALVDGQMLSDFSAELDGKLYVFNSKGIIITKPGWCSINRYGTTKWFYIEKNGTAAKGWKKIGGSWYFFDYYGWYGLVGSMCSGGVYLVPTSEGIKNNAYADLPAGDSYLFEQSVKLSTVKGAVSAYDYRNPYYWDDSKDLFYLRGDGAVVCNETIEIDGVEYYFGDNGCGFEKGSDEM